FAVQLWMFATPIIYLRADLVAGPAGAWLLPLNPAYGLILNFRQALLGGPLDWYALAVSGAVSALLLLAGALYFRRVPPAFGDVTSPTPAPPPPWTPERLVMDKLAVGIVGCGYWGPNLVRNFTACPRTEVVALCDANPARLEKVGRGYPHIKQVSTLDQLLE